MESDPSLLHKQHYIRLIGINITILEITHEDDFSSSSNITNMPTTLKPVVVEKKGYGQQLYWPYSGRYSKWRLIISSLNIVCIRDSFKCTPGECNYDVVIVFNSSCICSIDM